MPRVSYVLTKNANNALILSTGGGNTKTKGVVELTLVPRDTLDNWEAIKGEERNSIKKGKAYVLAIAEDITKVCPSECVHLKTKKCYVQHNARNASQVAAILDGLLSAETVSRDCLRMALKVEKRKGVDKVRAMVAGDAALLPKEDWTRIEKTIISVYPAKDWLAYTHGWRTAEHLKGTHLASVDTREERDEAKALGWNTFYSGDVLPETMEAGSTLCPSSAQFGNLKGYKIGCTSCPIGCNGDRPGRKHVIIPRHATGDNARQRAAGKRGVVIRDHKGRIRGLYAPTTA